MASGGGQRVAVPSLRARPRWPAPLARSKGPGRRTCFSALSWHGQEAGLGRAWTAPTGSRAQAGPGRRCGRSPRRFLRDDSLPGACTALPLHPGPVGGKAPQCSPARTAPPRSGYPAFRNCVGWGGILCRRLFSERAAPSRSPREGPGAAAAPRGHFAPVKHLSLALCRGPLAAFGKGGGTPAPRPISCERRGSSRPRGFQQAWKTRAQTT